MDFIWALFVWNLYMDFVCDLFPSSKEDKQASNTAMATRINITHIASFDIHDESNFAQRWKKWEQSVEFYLTASGTDNDSQMQALLLHCAGPDVQDIFMHLQDVGTTYKAAMDALNNHFESKKNVVFERHVFRQAMQGTNESSLTFVTRLRKLASTCEFENEIRDQFIDKCSSNRLRRRLLQEPNVTLENIVEKTQAMELAEMELFAMHPDEMQAGMARLKVTQDKYDFPSNKCCFRCRSSTHLANKCNIAKGKTCRKCRKVGLCGCLQIKTSEFTC